MVGCDAGRVQLLFLPPSAGIEQNPICVYYVTATESRTGNDDASKLHCIAEVTNTPWGDRVRFCFEPRGGFAFPKPMHVSPLQDMESSWLLSASEPAERLHLAVRCVHPTLGHFFHAILDVERVTPPADVELWAWLMPHKVTWWIYCHAARLLWTTAAAVDQRARDYRYRCGVRGRPRYRRDAGEAEEDVRGAERR